ncbi:MAG: Ig-like domain-containing protein, partial [Myxococcaceae bacterium]|nr:Ig-like domain-containing protein [Myxococcaceae bacterium]
MAPANAIVAENCRQGAPSSEWDVVDAGDASIQGFATDMSVNRGETVRFKVKTDATDYRLDIYRLGFYGGLGASRVATVQPSAALPQSQPACLTDAPTGLIDCGNWTESASWSVPADATSGIYLARLVREDGPAGASHVVFVVRDDDGGSDILYQTSDTTWQAYNDYGGNSLYTGSPAGRAYKVSYNRPMVTAGNQNGRRTWLFANEYPMVRWLEANGFHVSYSTGVDTHRRGAELLEHRVFLSSGHDEYWSATQRSNVEEARNAGVHLAFFSGNEVFWKTRWEPSIDGSGTAYRTLVSYKETHAGAKIDPDAAWTGTWRDPRFSAPADGGRPENALTGTLFTVNCCRADSITVPEADGKHRFWRNTSVSTLPPGGVATLSAGTLGFEWDEDVDNGARPPGLVRLSTTTVSGVNHLQDYGSTYASGTATHHLTLYRHSSGALVFGAGTVRWSWGLDGTHADGTSVPDVRIQQATVNLLADMRVQPGSLQPGLVAATSSTDVTPPTATLLHPSSGGPLPSGAPVFLRGTARDTGGRVAAVEVSLDDGVRWHPASGTESWSFRWVPEAGAAARVRARAVDDSGNLGAPSEALALTAALPPGEGPGGPILVVAHASNPFSRYYAEILLAEGLNLFEVRDLTEVTAKLLGRFDVALLGEGPLTSAQASLFTSWVQTGGNLIAMRPRPELASLLGLAPAGGTSKEAYLRLDTTQAPGAGLVGDSLQFHGTADRYTLSGATAVATLLTDEATPSPYPAVTLRAVGTAGGEAAAFTFDLARSIVYTRQGNPAWAGQERDGIPLLRSSDLFVGNTAPDWVNLDNVAIPQADEQQRLLTNLILHMARERKPLPRFWYFPREARAVVVMTGDDHATGGTGGRWLQHRSDSPAGCSVQDWECVRGTSYVFPGVPLTDVQAAAFEAEGFELALNVNTGCADFTPESLDST